MRHFKLTSALALVAILFFSSCSSESPREKLSFNDDWTFHLGDIAEASSVDYDDSSWRTLDLPHDWAIEGEFSAENPSGAGGGALPGGVGWYRKTFKLDKKLEGKKIFIDFDGVYMNSEVWINGTYLGLCPYGYISFRYDLTPYLSFDSENTIAVRVDNSEQPNSRWYSGCGIYRNVWLTTVEPLYVDLWGTYVTTPEVSEQKATVSVSTTIKSEMTAEASVKIETIIRDGSQNSVSTQSTTQQFKPGDSNVIEQQLQIDNPLFWSVDNPHLYTVSLVSKRPARADIRVVELPFTGTAESLGDTRVANMVALGALAKLTGALALDGVKAILEKFFPPAKHRFIPLNVAAIEAGQKLAMA